MSELAIFNRDVIRGFQKENLKKSLAMHTWSNSADRWANSTRSWVNSGGRWSDSSRSWSNDAGRWSNSTRSWSNDSRWSDSGSSTGK